MKKNMLYIYFFRKSLLIVFIVVCLLTSWFQTSAFPVQSQLILNSDPILLSIEMRWGGFNVFLDRSLKEEQENNVFTRQHSTPSALRPELIIVRTGCSQLFSTKIFWSGAPANCFGAKMWTRCNAFAADFGAWGQIWSCELWLCRHVTGLRAC